MLGNLPEKHFQEAQANNELKPKGAAVLAQSLTSAINPKTELQEAAKKETDKATPAPARIAFGGCSH